jgi:hypothetical protein
MEHHEQFTNQIPLSMVYLQTWVISMLNNELYACRVCGLHQDEAPWGEDGSLPSFNICDCCGTEFGYHDATLSAIQKSREKWFGNGAKWVEPKAQPKTWILEEQLQQIPRDFQKIQ